MENNESCFYLQSTELANSIYKFSVFTYYSAFTQMAIEISS